MLRPRREFRARERWTRQTLLACQRGALAVLRRDAVVASPFYRDLHRGLDSSRAREAVLRALEQVGVQLPGVEVSTVDAIPVGAAGKRPLVVARRRDG